MGQKKGDCSLFSKGQAPFFKGTGPILRASLRAPLTYHILKGT